MLTRELIEHVRRGPGPIAAPSEPEYVATPPNMRSDTIMRRHARGRRAERDLTTLEVCGRAA